MILYSLLAMTVSAALVYRMYASISRLLASDLYLAYFSLSNLRFSALYDATESSYDGLKALFNIKAKHYTFIEAMRAFEEEAQVSINRQLLDEFKFIALFLFSRLPLFCLAMLLFLPIAHLYVIAAIATFLGCIVWRAQKDVRNGLYCDISAYRVAAAAYMFRFGRDILKPDRRAPRTHKNPTSPSEPQPETPLSEIDTV